MGSGLSLRILLFLLVLVPFWNVLCGHMKRLHSNSRSYKEEVVGDEGTAK